MSAQEITFLKLDEEQRMVFGWASVATINDQTVVDSHNDIIPMPELTKAGADFMSTSRAGGVQHIRDDEGNVIKAAEVVFAWPFEKDINASMGVATTVVGLAIGVKVHDDGVWEMVKSGKLAAFSIGGRAKRRALDG